MTDVYAVLAAHLRAFWPQRVQETYTWELGRIKEDLPRFSVVRIAPAKADESWVYVTHGAWEVDAAEAYRMELVLAAPRENPRHIETLAMLAAFHADPAYHHLHLGRSVAIGRGWLEGSACDHLLISLPYPFGPELENCQITQDLLVRYLWALPITAAENAFLREHGLEALEERFDAAGIDFLDPRRRSVV